VQQEEGTTSCAGSATVTEKASGEKCRSLPDGFTTAHELRKKKLNY